MSSSLLLPGFVPVKDFNGMTHANYLMLCHPGLGLSSYELDAVFFIVRWSGSRDSHFQYIGVLPIAIPDGQLRSMLQLYYPVGFDLYHDRTHPYFQYKDMAREIRARLAGMDREADLDMVKLMRGILSS